MGSNISAPANSSGSNQVRMYDTLVSSTTRYLVLGFHGEGSFGRVAKCTTLVTGEEVAIKMYKESDYSESLKREIFILEKIRCLDPDKNHIVKFFEHFEFNRVPCLAFEMLDRSLWDLIEQRDWKPLSLNEIRIVTNQLMKALDALKSIGIIHADLKPDNVMLVNHEREPFRIKLIDFGVSMTMSDTWIGMEVQALSFRAPEVTLGLPLSEAIDVWGVGCTMAFLYFGGVIFPNKCYYALIRIIVHLLGLPEDRLLSAGIYTRRYFSLNDNPRGPRWRLKSPDEFQKETGIKPELFSSAALLEVENLEHLVYLQAQQNKGNDTECEDMRPFLSLLKSTLNMDPERRITPKEALESHFLSMDHLKDKVDPGSHAEEAEDSDPESDDTLCGIVFSSQEDPLQADKLTNELQAEKDRNKALQEELEQLRLSYHLLNAKYENNVIKIKEQVDALQHNLDKILPKEDNLQSVTVALQEENKSLQNQLEKTTESLHDLMSDLKRELEQKKLLETAYEELQEIHRVSQEKFSAQLHAEKEKNRILEQDLDKIRSSHCVSQRDETEVIVVTQEADTVQHELGVESHADSVSDGWDVLRAEQEAPCQKLAEEITVLKDKEELFGRELDELQTQLSLQLSLNLKFSTELKAERETPQKVTTPNAEPLEPRKETELPEEMLCKQQDTVGPVVACPEEMPCKQQETMSPAPACPQEMPCKQQETMSPAPACPEEMPCKQHSCIFEDTISPAPVLKSQKEAEGNIPKTAEPPSLWKRARHFLGLRKPKRWKKKKEDEN